MIRITFLALWPDLGPLGHEPPSFENVKNHGRVRSGAKNALRGEHTLTPQRGLLAPLGPPWVLEVGQEKQQKVMEGSLQMGWGSSAGQHEFSYMALTGRFSRPFYRYCGF